MLRRQRASLERLPRLWVAAWLQNPSIAMPACVERRLVLLLDRIRN